MTTRIADDNFGHPPKVPQPPPPTSFHRACNLCNKFGVQAWSQEQADAMMHSHFREEHPEYGTMLDILSRLETIMPLLETLAAARVVEVAR